MTKRRLPLAIESSLGRIEVLRGDLAASFESRARAEVSKRGFSITCTSGCAWCCHHPVVISVLEGILIYRWLVKQGKWTLVLKDTLKSSADQQFGIDPSVWMMALIPCPLLDEKNHCSVYPTRPLICRAYLAISDPHNCHPHRISKEDTHILPRDSVVDPFHSKQEEMLRRHKLQLITIPIGAALLMAERVCTENLDLSMIDSLLLKEYGEKT